MNFANAIIYFLMYSTIGAPELLPGGSRGEWESVPLRVRHCNAWKSPMGSATGGPRAPETTGEPGAPDLQVYTPPVAAARTESLMEDTCC